MLSNYFSCLVLLTVCFHVYSSQALFRVLSPISSPTSNVLIAKDYPDAPLNIHPKTFNVTGQLVVASPFHGCNGITNDVKGKIVIVLGATVCPPTKRAQNAKAAGAIGLVILGISLSRSHLGILHEMDYPVSYEILPTINIIDAEQVYLTAARNESEVFVEIRDTDYNPWAAMGNGPAGIIYRVNMILIALAIIAIAPYKWYRYYLVKEAVGGGKNVTIPQICLGIDFVAAIGVIIYNIQPLHFKLLFYSTLWDRVLEWTTAVLSYTTTFLIPFYWHEVLSSVSVGFTNVLFSHLDKLKIPFAVTIIFMTILSVFNCLLQAWVIELNFTYLWQVTSATWILVSAVAGLFFVLSGIKVLNNLRSFSPGHKWQMLKLGFMIFFIGFMYFILVAFLIIYLTPVLEISREVTFAAYWIKYLCFYLIGLAKVVSFVPPVVFDAPTVQSSTEIELK